MTRGDTIPKTDGEGEVRSGEPGGEIRGRHDPRKDKSL